MKEAIQNALEVLVGMPLVDSNRAADMQMFGFKETGEAANEYALHVQCPWRITGPEGIIVGRMDYYYPAGDPYNEPPDFDCDQLGANRRDVKISGFMKKHSSAFLVVERVEAGIVGSFRVTLTGGHCLEVFPDNSLEDENWRLFKGDSVEHHFVVTGKGIECDR